MTCVETIEGGGADVGWGRGFEDSRVRVRPPLRATPRRGIPGADPGRALHGAAPLPGQDLLDACGVAVALAVELTQAVQAGAYRTTTTSHHGRGPGRSTPGSDRVPEREKEEEEEEDGVGRIMLGSALAALMGMVRRVGGSTGFPAWALLINRRKRAEHGSGSAEREGGEREKKTEGKGKGKGKGKDADEDDAVEDEDGKDGDVLGALIALHKAVVGAVWTCAVASGQGPAFFQSSCRLVVGVKQDVVDLAQVVEGLVEGAATLLRGKTFPVPALHVESLRDLLRGASHLASQIRIRGSDASSSSSSSSSSPSPSGIGVMTSGLLGVDLVRDLGLAPAGHLTSDWDLVGPTSCAVGTFEDVAAEDITGWGTVPTLLGGPLVQPRGRGRGEHEAAAADKADLSDDSVVREENPLRAAQALWRRAKRKVGAAVRFAGGTKVQGDDDVNESVHDLSVDLGSSARREAVEMDNELARREEIARLERLERERREMESQVSEEILPIDIIR